MRLPTELKSFFRELKRLPPLLAVELAVALGLLVSLGVLSYRNLQRQAFAADWVAHTYQVAAAVQKVFSSVQDAESSQRAFIVSGTEAYLDPYNRAIRDLPGQLDTVSLLVSDNPRQIAQLKALRTDIDEKLLLVRLRIAQRHQLGTAALDPKYLNGTGVQKMEKVRADADLMIAEENSLLQERLRVLDTVRSRSEILQLVGGLTSLVLLTAAFVGLVKQTLRTNRAEQDAQRSNAQLRDANNELRAFSYSVAHDLRTPLRAIGGFAQVIVEDHAARLDPEGLRALGRITGNAKMMAQLIDDLLALSKITYQPLHSSKIDMTELVRGAYRDLMEMQDGRVVECEITTLPPASGDASLLRQVWINLIGNALKFTRQQAHPRIEIGGNVAGPEFASYYIRDNGAGFDMQYADKLFGAFQRLHRPADFEGTGIGLALVQRIVHRHGGTIWGEGKENDGAFFAFTLPEWVEP